jgi:hypothetical protein
MGIETPSEAFDGAEEIPSAKQVMEYLQVRLEEKRDGQLASLTGPEPDAEELNQMVVRFLAWTLPKTFAPDGGISFKPLNHPNSWPIGTNLLTATEAEGMLRHVLADYTLGQQRQAARVKELEGMLVRARSDIYQTARVNQAAINGKDLEFPNDPPCELWIGKHKVHQVGIDDSISLIKDIDAVLSTRSAAEAAIKSGGGK